ATGGSSGAGAHDQAAFGGSSAGLDAGGGREGAGGGGAGGAGSGFAAKGSAHRCAATASSSGVCMIVAPRSFSRMLSYALERLGWRSAEGANAAPRNGSGDAGGGAAWSVMVTSRGRRRTGGAAGAGGGEGSRTSVPSSALSVTSSRSSTSRGIAA